MRINEGQEQEVVTPGGFDVNFSKGLNGIRYDEKCDRWIWEDIQAVPGTEGYIYAVGKTNTEKQYAIKLVVKPVDYALYTTSNAIVSDPGKTYIKPEGWDNGPSYTINYIEHPELRMMYILPGYSGYSIVSAEAINANVNVYKHDNNIVEISLIDDFDAGNTTVEINLTADQRYNEDESEKVDFVIIVHFTDGLGNGSNSEPDGPGQDSPNGSSLPDGYEQLYDDNATVVQATALHGCGLKLMIPNGDGVKAVTAGGFMVTADTGTLTYNAENEYPWSWDLFDAVPTTEGYIRAVNVNNPDEKYAIKVIVDPANFGVYTSSVAAVRNPGEAYIIPNGEDFNGIKYTVDYSKDSDLKTVYVIPGYDSLSVAEACCDNDKIQVSISNDGKLVEIGLEDGINSGTYQSTITLKAVEERRDGEKRWDYYNIVVTFTDGAPMGGPVTDTYQLYAQYHNDDYETILHGWPPVWREFKLCAEPGSEAITDKNYEVWITEGLGNLGYNEEFEIWVWDYLKAVPGISGYIYAKNSSGKLYTMEAIVRPADYGLYTSLQANVNEPGNTYIAPDDENYGGYIYYINYQENAELRTVYVIPGYEGYSITGISSNNENVSANRIGTKAAIQLNSAVTSGEEQAIIRLSTMEEYGENDVETREFDIIVVFTDGSNDGIGELFFTRDGDVSSNWWVNAGEVWYVSFAIEQNGALVPIDNTYQYTISNGAIDWNGSIGQLVCDFTNAEEGNGWICAEDSEGNKYRLDLYVGPEQPDYIPPGDLISSGGAVEKEDCITREAIWVDNSDAVKIITISGIEYYMAVSLYGSDYPHYGSGMFPELEDGDYHDVGIEVGFYTKEGPNEYKRVNDDMQEQLTRMFSDLKIEVYPYDFEGQGNPPEALPYIYKDAMRQDSTVRVILKMGVENSGEYLIKAVGTLKNGDGTVFESVFFLNFVPKPNLYFTPVHSTEASTCSCVTQINEYLTNLSVNESSNVIIEIPKGGHEGYIQIPSHLGNMQFFVRGCAGAGTTTLKGGIIADYGFATIVENVCFEGNGSNYALTGKTEINASRCTFTNYEIAIDGYEQQKSAGRCTFINNGKAIYFGEGQVCGNPSYNNNTFIRNGVALDITYFDKDYAMTSLDVSDNAFIDNEVDIHNGSGRRLFIPGCYFAYTDENGDEIVRKCIYEPIGNQNGEGGGNLKKQVLFYPQAADPNFESYIFDTRHKIYEGKNPIVSVNFTSTFKIPVGALDGATFDVMKHDELLARITFEPAQQLFRMRFMTRSTEPEEAKFDATVDVVRSEDGKTITVTLKDIPGGKTPWISIPCDDTWETAEVTAPDGFKLDEENVEIAEGFISFVANSGGTYTITNLTEDDETENEGGASSSTPSASRPSGGSGSSGGSTSEDTVRNEDGSVTTTVTDEKTGTVTETTNYKDGTVLEIVSTSEGSEPPTVKATVPSGVKAKVTIPVENVSAGTVAVIVHADGTEEVVQYCVPGEDGLMVQLEESAQLKIVDNAKDFNDVAENTWYKAAVDFVSARGIMNGTAKDTFNHKGTTTRAMVWTMLANLNGADVSGGANWYDKGQEWAKENGISDGSNPNNNITREQLAVMLWNLSGSPEQKLTSLDGFTDSEGISGYAQQAMAWAIEKGIISGMGNGVLNSRGNATRAQAAQILMNYMMKM